jgi:hypothetical protein
MFSLRSIILFTNIDVSRVDTSILVKSIMDHREYLNPHGNSN